MELLTHLIDIVLHLDVYLATLVGQYGLWIYAILFAIIFAETGLVVTPFLPGDSLLFVAGALAAVGDMDIGVLVLTLSAAAVMRPCGIMSAKILYDFVIDSTSVLREAASTSAFNFALSAVRASICA